MYRINEVQYVQANEVMNKSPKTSGVANHVVVRAKNFSWSNTPPLGRSSFPWVHLEKLNVTQQKNTFTNQKKCTAIQNKHKKLKPGLVTYSYFSAS